MVTVNMHWKQLRPRTPNIAVTVFLTLARLLAILTTYHRYAVQTALAYPTRSRPWQGTGIVTNLAQPEVPSLKQCSKSLSLSSLSLSPSLSLSLSLCICVQRPWEGIAMQLCHRNGDNACFFVEQSASNMHIFITMLCMVKLIVVCGHRHQHFHQNPVHLLLDDFVWAQAAAGRRHGGKLGWSPCCGP
jgi:hypothetical protein